MQELALRKERLRGVGHLWRKQLPPTATSDTFGGMSPSFPRSAEGRVPARGKPPGLLTATEAAAVLGLTSRRVAQLASAGQLEAAMLTPWGRLFARAEVERLARVRAEARAPGQT